MPETTDQYVCRMLAESNLVTAPWQRKLMVDMLEREAMLRREGDPNRPWFTFDDPDRFHFVSF